MTYSSGVNAYANTHPLSLLPLCEVCARMPGVKWHSFWVNLLSVSVCRRRTAAGAD